MDLERYIAAVPDFPKPGILFRDITPLLASPQALGYVTDSLAAHCARVSATHLAAIESRGFLFAAPLALRAGLPLQLVRKPGKLPRETLSCSYDLEYGSDELQIHRDAFGPGDRVLLIDDLLATGGTAGAAVKLIKQAEAEVVSAAFVIELSALGGRENIACDIFSIVQF